MTEYDFKKLSDVEFEKLCCRLIAYDKKIDFTSFRSGRDKGIDLYSDEENIVVQVKHYANSTFSNLRTSFKNEAEKVDKLKPTKYIIMTSFDLTKANCDELMAIVNANHKHIHSIDDIYHLSKLNSLLSLPANKHIVSEFYKLWITGTSVLERIYNNAHYNDIEYRVEDIESKMQYYVQTASLDNALEQLKHKQMLIIHGEPGIGKTTLANMIVMNYLEKGYTLKFISGNNLNELLKILSPDKESEEIIFIDDFLGANFLELCNSNSENQLVSFLDKYKSLNNKKVVLTTRTSIYNKAKTLYEKLERIDSKFSKFLLEVNNYSEKEKALVLYNHCYFRIDRKDLFEEIKIRKKYIEIVRHKNYNPRLIEYITDSTRISSFIPCKYIDFIDETLNNPKEIWKHEFLNKIGDEERFLIETLFSFNGKVDKNILEKAFNARYDFEIKNSNIKRNYEAFDTSLKTLSNSFIKITLISSNQLEYIVEFYNPSISDFLINYLKKNIRDKERIIESVKYAEQLDSFNIFEKSIHYEQAFEDSKINANAIRKRLLNSSNELEELNGSIKSTIVTLVSYYYPNDQKLLALEYEYSKLWIGRLWCENNRGDYKILLNLLSNRDKKTQIGQFMNTHISMIFEFLWSKTNYLFNFISIIESFKKFDASLISSYIDEDDEAKQLQKVFDYEVNEYITDNCISDLDLDDYLEDDVEDYDENDAPIFDETSIDWDLESEADSKCDEVEKELFTLLKNDYSEAYKLASELSNDYYFFSSDFIGEAVDKLTDDFKNRQERVRPASLAKSITIENDKDESEIHDMFSR